MNLQVFFQEQLILKYSQILEETEIKKITKKKKTYRLMTPVRVFR